MFTPKQNPKLVDVTQTVENIFFHAVNQGASDIHIEPSLGEMYIRYRVDGIMKVVFRGDRTLFDTIIARIKVLAMLDTTGLPRPQEGKVMYKHKDKDIDFRVSIFPTSMGEAVVIRVLENLKEYDKFENLGFSPEQTELLEATIKKPYGLVLVTGPNGSGKSTTLFTLLKKLNSVDRSIATLEDPVERHLDMVRQTQVDPDNGLSFAEGLRFLLRQDPDIIMVGEIRDKETAQIAVQAAITGHLVLATIHTNNAAGAIVRLINMQVEPFLLATSLRLVTAQRLARVNCPHCREEYAPPQEIIKKLNLDINAKYYHSLGCDKCEGRGTSGRIGIHEVLPIDRSIENLILTCPSDDQINELAGKNGMISLHDAAFRKAREGEISIEEAIRVVE
jgi:type IV pilus assembly protein PilB